MNAENTSPETGKSLVLVGRVTETGFEDGFIKILSLSDNPNRFNEGNTLLIDFYKNIKQFTIAYSEELDGYPLICFEGFEDEEKTFVFNGKELFIEESEIEQLPDTKWYLHELLDCEVYQRGERIGKVTDVFTGDPHDILAIMTEQWGEVLIPTVTEIILKLNREQKQLELNPDILLYDDEN